MTARPANPTAPRVAIIGGGIIGLSCAFELAIRRSVPVTLFDPAPFGRGASWAAAGMLAPAFEAAAEEGAHPHLFDLCHHGAELWPAFAADVGQAAGTNLGFSAGPSLALAFDQDQTADLHHLARALDERGIAHEELRPVVARETEPAISERLVAALHLPTDGQVDNRAVVTALIAALQACPHATLRNEAAPLEDNGKGLHLPGHDAILVTAGWNTAAVKVHQNGDLFSLVNWDTSLDEINCIGGQMMSVACGPDLPKMTLRCGPIYIAPKADRVIVGATMEPGIATAAPEPDKIAQLRADAARLCPAIAEAPELETWAGIRPGTPDRAPLIGATATPGLFIAAGHYRNGILLAPITARIMADLILGGPVMPLAREFRPDRAYTTA
ncbi:MAG: FAD-dependent oxidoreductase [Hyphomonas sp.]